MRSTTRWRTIRERLRERLWPVPALATVLAIAAAFGLIEVDRRLSWSDAWYVFTGGPVSAREILSTIASSTMTFTGLVFSITVLVLQLASGQFSPRAIRTFLRERSTKIALGTFVGTFVYSLALLTQIRSGEATFVPAFSVWLAFFLALASVGVFIHYIDHMAHSIRAVTIICRIGDETRASLEAMFPAIGEDAQDEGQGPPQGEPDLTIANDEPGVITTVDAESLLEEARRSEAVIALVPRLGDFAPGGGPLFRIWGGERVDPARLCHALAIRKERTLDQDPAAGFRQLVDVAERALSPGVNDPTTAVQALDQLHDLVRRLAFRRFPSPLRLDPNGTVRLVLPRPSFEDYVHLAFDEIDRYGAASIQVNRKIRTALEDCLSCAPTNRQPVLRDALRRHEAQHESQHEPREKDRGAEDERHLDA